MVGDVADKAGLLDIKEHWAQSGFANTDLDFKLKQHSVTTSSPWACLLTPASN